MELFARQWCDCPDDVVQEALIELVAQPRTPDDVAAWLYRVVRNKAITAWRSAQRRRRHETEAVAHRSAAFERSAADRIDAGVAAAALDSLSIELREVVVARIWGGLTFQQIGRLVGVSDSAAHRRYEAGLVGPAPEIEGAMSEERLSDELAAIEAALGSLTPAPSAIRPRPADVPGGKGVGFWSAAIYRRFLSTRQRRAAVRTTPTKAAMNRRTPKLLWPIATAASLMAAATFGILWAAGNKPQLAEHTAGVSIANSSPTIDLPADTLPPSPWENRRLCQLVLEKGIDALPEPNYRCVSGTPLPPRDDTYRSLLKQFLDNPTG